MMRAFVAYPYVQTPLPNYRSAFVNVAAQTAEVEFVFADEKVTSDSILAKIRQDISSCAFGLFDITHWNPNVALELGIAIGMRRDWFILFNPAPPVHRNGWLKKRIAPQADVITDIKGYDRIEYTTHTELEGKLAVLVDQRIRHMTPQAPTAWKKMRSDIKNVIKAHRGTGGIGVIDIAEELEIPRNLVQATIKDLLARNEVQKSKATKGTGTKYV